MKDLEREKGMECEPVRFQPVMIDHLQNSVVTYLACLRTYDIMIEYLGVGASLILEKSGPDHVLLMHST